MSASDAPRRPGAGGVAQPARDRRWTRLGVVFTIVAGLHIAVIALLALQPVAKTASSDDTPIPVMMSSGIEALPGLTSKASKSPPPASPAAGTSPAQATTSPIGIAPPQPAAVRSTSQAPQGPSDGTGDGAEMASQPSSAGIAAGQGCDLEAQVQARLTRDTAVLSALQSLPANAMSVANAVELWNGAWIVPKPDLPDPLIPLRVAILETIAAAKPGCRLATVLGPRLMLVEAGDQTYVVSLGSGSWRWNDLTTSYPLLKTKLEGHSSFFP